MHGGSRFYVLSDVSVIGEKFTLRRHPTKGRIVFAFFSQSAKRAEPLPSLNLLSKDLIISYLLRKAQGACLSAKIKCSDRKKVCSFTFLAGRLFDSSRWRLELDRREKFILSYNRTKGVYHVNNKTTHLLSLRC